VENITNEPALESDLRKTVPENLPDEYTPDNPPWTSLQAIVLLIVNVALIYILPSLLIIPYFLVTGKKIAAGENALQVLLSDPWAVSIALGGTFLAHILVMIAAWIIITKFNRFSFTEMLGWKWGGFKFWHGFVILIGVYVVAVTFSSLLGNPDNEMMQLLRSSRTAVIIVAIIATFSAPVVEEVVFRGVLYSAFQKSFGVPAAVFGVTFLFAIAHVGQYYPNFASIISVTILSLILTLIRVRTGNLWPCIFFHFIFNGIQAILLVAAPYLPEMVDPMAVDGFIK
jgi:uncharacterized protein